MKKYTLISFSIIIVALILLGSQLLSSNKDIKVKNFNESLIFEKDYKYDKALAKLQEIYDSNKDDYLINLRIGWLQFLLKNYNTSITYYNKAFEISKNKSIEALFGLTYPLAAKSDWTSTINTYKKILSIAPDNYLANLRLGQILLNDKKYSESLTFLEKAYNSFPSEYDINVSLSWLYYYLGKNSEAKKLFINTMMISPNDSLATIGLNLVR